MHNIHSYHIFIYGICGHFCTVSMTAVFHTHRPSSSSPLLFVFISPNCTGHILSYPIVVILLVDGRVYAPCPNKRSEKTPFQAVSSDISVLCPLLSNHFCLPLILFVNPSGIMCYVNITHSYMCAKSLPIFP